MLPPQKKKTSQSLCLPVCVCVSLPLSDGVLLPCIQGLGSLSLPFPPPPLPARDPTLRPHPSSLCQSGAAQPCRGAEPPATRHRLQPGRRRGAAAADPRTNAWGGGIVALVACACSHPCNPPSINAVLQRPAAYCSEMVERSTHVTLLTSASRLIEDTSAGWGGW